MPSAARPPAIHLRGSAADLLEALSTPETLMIISRAKEVTGAIWAYQLAALIRLFKPYDGQELLEIGCFEGRSALAICLACPHSHLTTMSPDPQHVERARRTLSGQRAEVLRGKSWHMLRDARLSGFAFGAIFIDGDHRQALRDLEWFNRLRPGGLLLFHDYTRQNLAEPKRIHPGVCAAVDHLSSVLHRGPDVTVIDENGVGMAGFYRSPKENYDGELP